MRKYLTAHKCVRLLRVYSALVLILVAVANAAWAQNLDGIERGRTKDLLKTIKTIIKKNYYDAAFHGMDLDARFKIAEDKIDQATTIGQAHGIIAQVLFDLNDSHTYFIPPGKNVSVDYGWKMQMIGDKCYVIEVKPKSAAETKGLKPGDEILSVEGFRPNRKEMWKMDYYYYALSPRTSLHLVVQSPNEKEPRQLEVESKITRMKRTIDLNSSMDIMDLIRESEDDANKEFHRFQRVGNVMIWKMPNFAFDPRDVDSIMKDRVANNTGLILDLRGNGGGLVVTLEQLAGYFFDKDTKIADLKGRKEEKPQMAKSQGGNGFKGKVVVLVDSKSGSASEIFARLMQLEKRGIVIGDQSSGSVMQSRFYQQSNGTERVVFYGVSVTGADVIMSDGKSLEHVGVTPDERIIPTNTDLATQRDPVLARALELVGPKVSAEEAGKIFPVKWDK